MVHAMEGSDQIIRRVLNEEFEKARQGKLKKVIILNKCLDQKELSWFADYKNSIKSTFDTVFATTCNLRFNRYRKGQFDFFSR